MARAEGFESFVDYASNIASRSPLRLAGSPVPKIQAGAFCLNDPAVAEEYLAVFRIERPGPTVTRTGDWLGGGVLI
jgi:hypothetical protein